MTFIRGKYFFFLFSLEKVTFACLLYMVKFWEIGYFYKYFIFIFLVEVVLKFFARANNLALVMSP